MLTVALTWNKRWERKPLFHILFHTKLHENRHDRFCCAAQQKKYDCEILIDRESIIFFIQNKAKTHVAQKVPVDDFISGRLVSALGRRFAAALLPRLQSRPWRVDFKLSVAHSPAGPSDSESGRALAWVTWVKPESRCLGAESSAARWF